MKNIIGLQQLVNARQKSLTCFERHDCERSPAWSHHKRPNVLDFWGPEDMHGSEDDSGDAENSQRLDQHRFATE